MELTLVRVDTSLGSVVVSVLDVLVEPSVVKNDNVLCWIVERRPDKVEDSVLPAVLDS